MHLPFPTYCRQPPTRWLQRHLHAFLRRCPLGTDFATSLAGSSIVQAESRSLSLRSTGFLLSCSPPRLAATQLLFGYHLLAWFQCAGFSHPAGFVLLNGARGATFLSPGKPGPFGIFCKFRYSTGYTHTPNRVTSTNEPCYLTIQQGCFEKKPISENQRPSAVLFSN